MFSQLWEANAPSISPSMPSEPERPASCRPAVHRLAAHGILARRGSAPEGHDPTPSSFKQETPHQFSPCWRLRSHEFGSSAKRLLRVHSPDYKWSSIHRQRRRVIRSVPRPRVCPPSRRQSPLTRAQLVAFVRWWERVSHGRNLCRRPTESTCSIMYASSPACAPRLLPPPSTTAPRIVLSAISSQMLLSGPHGFPSALPAPQANWLGRPSSS